MSSSAKKPLRRRAWFKLIRFLISFALLLLTIGFGVFLLAINKSAPPDKLPKVDGIVVLTGKGGGRLEAGALLLANGYGERLLISGVNPANDAEKIRSLLKLEDKIFTCCVDLDYEAENTVDNGRQTANWARALGYENIILVTSSYHMPRAKVEISAAMDGIKIIPYPVKSSKKAGAPWWGGKDMWSRLFREYGKLLISYAREPGARPNSK